MFIIRPFPPTRAGRRPRAVRRFLLVAPKPRAHDQRFLVIEKRYRPSPKIGFRRCVADDLPMLSRPPVFFTRPARLCWDDVEFCGIRAAIGAHYAAGRAMSDAEAKADDDEFQETKAEFARTWGECKQLAFQIFNPEPQTIRDLFLRAEMLTMHYGDGQIEELLDDDCPAHRMLGGLLQAMWKVGGAAHV